MSRIELSVVNGLLEKVGLTAAYRVGCALAERACSRLTVPSHSRTALSSRGAPAAVRKPAACTSTLAFAPRALVASFRRALCLDDERG